ncbi:hypothetical protein AAVH_19677 [Aphelenchoides avenae]|nr:hypothetical protein AAVH_19677 [Aphelenchus avenae]
MDMAAVECLTHDELVRLIESDVRSAEDHQRSSSEERPSSSGQSSMTSSCYPTSEASTSGSQMESAFYSTDNERLSQDRTFRMEPEIEIEVTAL